MNTLKTTVQDSKWLPNPTGKGGFADNPQHRNAGGRIRNPMKEFMWKRFNEMSDKQKENAIKKLPIYQQIILAEGNPRQDTEITGRDGVPILVMPSELITKNEIKPIAK